MHCTLYIPSSAESFDRDVGHAFETTLVPQIGDEVCLMYKSMRFFRVQRRRYGVAMDSSMGLAKGTTIELWCEEIMIA